MRSISPTIPTIVSFTSLVIRGEQRGRTIGIPTINCPVPPTVPRGTIIPVNDRIENQSAHTIAQRLQDRIVPGVYASTTVLPAGDSASTIQDSSIIQDSMRYLSVTCVRPYRPHELLYADALPTTPYVSGIEKQHEIGKQNEPTPHQGNHNNRHTHAKKERYDRTTEKQGIEKRHATKPRKETFFMSETHLLSFHQNVYGTPCTIFLHWYLRPNKRMRSLAELQATIRADIAQTNQLMDEHLS